MTMAFLLSHILKSGNVVVTSVLVNFLSQEKEILLNELMTDKNVYGCLGEGKIFEMFLLYNT